MSEPTSETLVKLQASATSDTYFPALKHDFCLRFKATGSVPIHPNVSEEIASGVCDDFGTTVSFNGRAVAERIEIHRTLDVFSVEVFCAIV